MMWSNIRRFVYIGLALGFAVLFAACSNNATTGNNGSVVSQNSSSNGKTVAQTSGQAGSLKLALACSSPDSKDGVNITDSHASACVYTSPGAKLDIKVNLCGDQLDTSSALKGEVVAGSNGFYKWDWTPQASCKVTSSAWNVTVTAHLNGDQARATQGSSSSSMKVTSDNGGSASSSISSSSDN
ncbi:hypothetical protein EPA93_08595 [Ktedonosporobacter rubrisoli]|uniref:DUF3558 domain-containing protein n=1 Tax=Ktedonosporobacter rubrisoli TaxID=2509675 RepID=A0A4P6JLZ7_KTERU|nr:hypothetical protein [Ktedonosporobacter rubrisoli]QBD76060.1 hypothetical protein EPA93_08595 [Ktedonosporobacter rubrisoli]